MSRQSDQTGLGLSKLKTAERQREEKVGAREKRPESPLCFLPRVEEETGLVREVRAARGRLIESASAVGILRALMRSAEHHALVSVDPVELTRLAPVGRLVTADKGAESGVLAELLIRNVGTMRLAAALEATALTAPLLLSRRLASALRRAENSRAERSELGCLLSRLSRGRPSEVLLSRATLRHGA